jgi:hypothetical protein
MIVSPRDSIVRGVSGDWPRRYGYRGPLDASRPDGCAGVDAVG